MPPFDITDAQSTFSFAIQQATNLEPIVYKLKYPSFDFASLVPVVTEGNEWARSTTFFSTDIVGKAQWLSGQARDIPYADIDRSKYETPFLMAGIGYEWNIEEIAVAQMLNLNLSADKADAARRIAQQFLWGVAMMGKGDLVNSEKGWTGLINDATVTASNAAATGVAGSTYFADKTPDQILSDINTAIIGVFTGTNETETADTILLPTAVYQSLATVARSSTSDTTILQFLRDNNAYTQETGQPLLIRGLRVLNTAAAGGHGRMIIYRRAPDVLRFHLPMPHRFLPVWQNSPMNYMVPGIMRTGGLEIRLPKAVRYIDLISA